MDPNLFPTMDPNDPNAQAAAGSSGAGALGIIIPAIAAIASAATPGLARGVQAGLGAYGAIDRNTRLKQALADAKQKQDLLTTNAGRLIDHYTVQPPPAPVQGPPSPGPNRPALYESADTGPQQFESPRVSQFIDEHGLPKNALFSPDEASFGKALIQANPMEGINWLQGRLKAANEPSAADLLSLPSLKHGQKLETGTPQGKVTLTGEEQSAAHIRTEIRDAQGKPNPPPGQGFKWDVGIGPSGNEVYARNTGEAYTASESPEHFRSLLALRSVGQTTGDSRIDQMPPERAAALYRQPPATINMQQVGRSDKSYALSTKQLDTLSGPIDQRLQRLSTLQDTIHQNTPQADALIAPELLTIMAGGQGSGLRMNEAEIARIIGGRTNLESLKAAANKWQLDPSKGLSVTPAQRAQIQALVSTVHNRLIQKKAALDSAYEELVGAETPEQHRQIVNRARRAVSAADAAPARQGGPAAPASLAGTRPPLSSFEQ